MTALVKATLKCPACGKDFETRLVTSTNSFGGKRTDFHERAAGTQPLPYLVQMCCFCGYAGVESCFTNPDEISDEMKQHIWEEVTNIRSLSDPKGSDKYEAAAKCAKVLGEEIRHIADLFLRAAWCAVDEGDVEAERYYRRHAAWSFQEALEMYDQVDKRERAVLTYLVGELWRRIGDCNKAQGWFDLVPVEIIDPSTQQWILDAAMQQSSCPRDWFG